MTNQSLIGIGLTIPDISSVLKNVGGLGSSMPNLQRAIQDSTLLIQQTWQNYAMGATVSYSGGTFVIRPNAEYARSIQRQVPYRGKLSGLVYSNSAVADRIEKGFSAFDMKPKLLASQKAKIGKDGTRYITVPFRHNTPGAGATGAPMPKSIYNQARKLDFSSITGRAPWGAFTYEWGGRLPANPTGQRTKLPVGDMTGAYTWKSGQYSGMVRMKDAATGRSAGYLTFRRVSTKSDPNSWWHPGVKPKPVMQAVVENTREQVLQILRTGAALDLAMAGLPIPTDLR